ncbi:MAG: AhpC/TSA family protein [Bacteroides sp.]|nr:AhpC/TSA family protein [Bacteroides sp.]
MVATNSKSLMMAVCTAVAVSLSSCADKPKGYVIEGSVVGTESGTIYLKKYEDRAFTDADSAVITDGKFRFEGVTPEDLAYGLTTVKDSRSPLMFFLANEHINVQIDESANAITVSGSPVNDLYFSNQALVGQDGYRIDSLVAAHPSSAVTPYLLMHYFAWSMNLEQLNTLRSQLDASLNGTFYVNQIDSLMGRLESLQVGSVAPDFTLLDPNGQPLSLSSFRGKYVWVDFWASWCPDCRRENPSVVAAYQRFKDKNFTVFGVSLDRKEEAWLNAIEKDGLTWSHVVDLRAWQADVVSLYAIRWVPMGYLLDPNGVILASSTTAQGLIDKLEEVLGD